MYFSLIALKQAIERENAPSIIRSPEKKNLSEYVVAALVGSLQ